MPGFLAIAVKQQRGARSRPGEVRVKTRFIAVVEKSGEAVKIFLTDGIILVVMTASASKGETEERGAGSRHAVGNVLRAEFFFDAAAFVGLAMEAVERRGHEL